MWPCKDGWVKMARAQSRCGPTRTPRRGGACGVGAQSLPAQPVVGRICDKGRHAQHIDELATAMDASEESKQWSPEISRLEALSDGAEMQQLDYAESWAWVHWLLETTPRRREVLQDYLRTLRKDGKAGLLSEWLFEHEIDFGAEQLAEYVRDLAEQDRQ